MGVTPEVRPALAGLQPYEPGKPSSEVRRELGLERVIKLGSNEGPLGPFPSALAAIQRAAPELNRYPELGFELIERLAGLHGVERSWVSLGHGADSIVWHLSVAYLDPGDEAVMCWPSFPSYHLDAIKCAATPVHVALRDGAYDLEALADRISDRTRIAYVCNPNNPTGGIVDAAALERFLEAVPERVVVVVDEAYHEYVDAPGYPDTIATHVRTRPNVVVLRTFSKIYGLAGLRVGYAVAPAGISRDLARVRPPFEVNELAHVAAAASLDDPAEIARRRALKAEGRAGLVATCSRLGLTPLPAYANFVCVPVGDGRAVANSLLHEGVVVRPLDQFGDAESIRVTVGTPEENAVFAAALERVLGTR
jgi:histidinol-phosphate aminotransferase